MALDTVQDNLHPEAIVPLKQAGTRADRLAMQSAQQTANEALARAGGETWHTAMAALLDPPY